jgi:ABC-type branched-subunit amino acid transport system ATPase component
MSDLLTVSDVRKSFGGLTALNGVTFNLREGEVLGIIGPNGAGKSTLFDVISGFTKPDAGTVRIGAEDLTFQSPTKRIGLGLARTFQTPRVFPNASVEENVATGTFRWNRTPLLDRCLRLRARRHKHQSTVAHILERVGLGERRRELAGDLPYGQQKILEIARALAAEPKMIILDEPMAGLNEDELDRMSTLVGSLREDGLAVILIEHHLSAVATLCERVVVLHHGQQIAFGPVEDVFTNVEVRNAYAPASA